VHRSRIEEHEGATTVLVASENPAPHETRGDVARRTNIEIDALQLLRLEFHLVGPTDELCILNLKNCFGLGGVRFEVVLRDIVGGSP
jgi:hypothetical protein